MTRLPFALLSLAIAGLFSMSQCHIVNAQSFRVRQPAPDCRLLQSRYDNPFSDTHGYVQARVLWHLEYAAASYATTALLNKIIGLPPWLSAAIAFSAIGLAPHVRGILEHRYAINPLDLAYDAANRATPFVWLAGTTPRAIATWFVADAALACFSSP